MSVQLETKSVNESGASEPRRSARDAGSKNNSSADRTKSYDSILWRIIEKSKQPEHTTTMFGFLGAAENAGTTTVATNVALRAASVGLGQVLLIDCNHLRPKIHKLFRLKRPYEGLIEYISGNAELKSVVRETELDNLYVMPYASRARVNEIAVPDPRFLPKLLEEIRGLFDIVVVDLPVSDQLTHVAPLVRQLNASILVVRSDSLRRNDATQCIKHLENYDIKLAGSVMNRTRRYMPAWIERFL